MRLGSLLSVRFLHMPFEAFGKIWPFRMILYNNYEHKCATMMFWLSKSVDQDKLLVLDLTVENN